MYDIWFVIGVVYLGILTGAWIIFALDNSQDPTIWYYATLAMGACTIPFILGLLSNYKIGG
jgi:hypothetical protein